MKFTSQWDTKYRANPKTNDSLKSDAPKPFVIKHLTYHHKDYENDFLAQVSLCENGIGGELYLHIEILKDEKELSFLLRPNTFSEFLDKVNELVNNQTTK